MVHFARSRSGFFVAPILVLAAGALAGAPQNPSLQGCPLYPQGPIPVGLGPQGIAQGDLDGDGYADLVVANTLDNTIQILRNDFGRAFIPDLELLNSFGQPVGVAVGDLNGDGALDIAAANRLGDTVTIYLNNGKGGFNSEATDIFPVGDGPVGLVLLEIPDVTNGKGGPALDIVTANANSGDVSVIYNDGIGGAAFIDTIQLDFGKGPPGVSAIAADDDERIVYVAMQNYGSVAVIYDDFDNGFDYNDDIFVKCQPIALAVGSFDFDDTRDLVVLCAEEFLELFDNEGLDLRGGFQYFFNFVQTLDAPGNPRAVVLDDFSGDFPDDIAYASGDNSTVTVFFNSFDLGRERGEPYQQDFNQVFATELGPAAMVALDSDNDNDIDLAVANADDSNVSVLRNKTGFFLPPADRGFPNIFATFVVNESGVEPAATAFGDVDFDGDADLVTANSGSDDVSLYINLGNGRYADEERYPVGIDPSDVAFADINNDKLDDIIVANRESDNVTLLLTFSDVRGSRFQPPVHYPVGDSPVALAVHHLDNNAGVEVAVALENNGVVVLFNQGNGVLSPPVTVLGGVAARDIAVGDVDFDLDQDLAVVDPVENGVRLLFNNGSGEFTPSGFLPTEPGPTALVLNSLDFNVGARSAPDLDIAVACESGSVSIYRNEGFASGDFFLEQNLYVAPGLNGISVGPADGDGDFDLVVTSSVGAAAYILVNTGNGQFLPSMVLPIGNGAAGPTFANLDFNNRADLAVANPADNMVAVITDLGPIPQNPPVITQLPQVQVISRSGYVEDQHIRITVGVAGNSPFAFRWFRDENEVVPDGKRIILDPVTGALDINPLELFDDGFYEVLVIDSCGLESFASGVDLFVNIRDTDGDGVRDDDDNCPLDFNPTQQDIDEDGLGDACDPDIDGDELPNEKDNCPEFFNPDQTNLDGDDLGDPCDDDVDGDGVNNKIDNCEFTPNADQLDTDKDGEGDACDADDDNDGVLDVNDNCPTVTNPEQANQDGDAFGDACDNDRDNDGVPDEIDNCPDLFNPDQIDADKDNIGDACDANVDADHDGIDDGIDNCPGFANPSQADQDFDGIGDDCDTDLDGDGVPNATDNCLFVPNPAQANIDGDMLGDSCDPDIDEDGVLNAADNCPGNFNPGQENLDGDNLGDICDPDRDNDGILNAIDNCPDVANPSQADEDENGIGDACEGGADSDEDGVPNSEDNCPTIFNPDQQDSDKDGFGDACDEFPNDFDNDGVPDKEDNCPTVYNPAQVDNDGDGLGDADHTFPNGEVFALGYSAQRNQMFLSDISSELYIINVLTGGTTFVGTMNDQLDGDIKGLAFLPGKGETLVGIENGFGTPASNRIHHINPDNADIFFTVQVTLKGHEVRNSNGLAYDPSSGNVYALLRTRLTPMDPTVNRLVTVDPNSGIATLIGDLPTNFATIAFDAAGDLYGVTGDGGTPPETLFLINKATAGVTELFTLGNGDDGEAIAFHPNGLMYHASGNGDGDEYFESVNVETQVVIDLGAGCDKFPDDFDNDGVPDANDNCPFDFNPDQADSDEDGIGDVCEGSQNDMDKDGVPDDIDNCPTVANADQSDVDEDGDGDACDNDIDNDKFSNESDNCPSVFNPGQEDGDEDGVGDVCDNCRRLFNPEQEDTVGRPGCPAPDGVGDACDCDGDADRDGDIDFADITEVLTNFNFVYSCPSLPPNNAFGDADLNGAVNFADITAVLRSFQLPCGPPPQ